MLGILMMLPSIVFSKSSDGLDLIHRLLAYSSTTQEDSVGSSHTVYYRYNFMTLRRNPTLYLVPSMYKLAHGERNYVGETYGYFTRMKNGKYLMQKQVTAGTIAHYRKAMPTVIDLMLPHIYSVSLYDKHLLSPFNKKNIKFYKYKLKRKDNKCWILEFKPRIANTQLVKGDAIIDAATARVQYMLFRGEYDMIHFTVGLDMGTDEEKLQIPIKSHVSADLKFLGNHTTAKFLAYYDIPKAIPDTATESTSLELMDQLRPCPLTKWEEKIYSEYYQPINTDSITTLAHANGENDTTTIKAITGAEKYKRIKKATWTALDDYVWSSLHAQMAHGEIKMSPVINPVSLAYSPRRGLSYKLKLNSNYNFSEKSKIDFNPYIGYNFKVKQFFYEIPIRYTFNSMRDGWIQFKFRNGNRIYNSSIFESIKNQRKDTIDFNQLELTYFDDKELRLDVNLELTRLLDIQLGVVYHSRKPVKEKDFEQVGVLPHFRTFAPTVSVRMRPYVGGPILAVNYERGIKGIYRANSEYERWEFDASMKKKMQQQRYFNIKIGGGFYSNKSTTYFVDYENFHQDNLPEGWNDDWTGDFQLLNSNWYNASKFYARANTSYESPLMIFSRLPLIGKIIESERIYGGLLFIEHSKPYWEVGYGFTNKYFSIAAFTSLLNEEIYNTGIKFSFELFRKW